MRLLSLVFLFVFAFSAIADVGPVGRSTHVDGTGTLKGPLEQWFINVKNTSGGALLDGDLVILDVSNDDGYSVTTSSTAGAVPHCVLNEACASNAFCSCQTYGLKTNVNFDAGVAATAGALAFLSESNAGFVSGNASIGAADVALGVFYDSSSSSGDIEVFLQLR